MCEAVSIIHSLTLGGHKHNKHNKPTNKKAANQSNPDLGAQLMRGSQGNKSSSVRPAMSPSYLERNSKPSQGVQFSELSRGQVKNFCCDQSLALDQDLVQLLQPEKNVLDLYRDVLAANTNRVLQKLVQRYHHYSLLTLVTHHGVPIHSMKVWKRNRSVLFRER